MDKLIAMWFLFCTHAAMGFGFTAGMWVFCKMTRWAPANLTVGTRIINVSNKDTADTVQAAVKEALGK